MGSWGHGRPVVDSVPMSPVPGSGRMEQLAQAVAERVVSIVMDAIDIDALLQRVDVDALIARVDVDDVVSRVGAASPQRQSTRLRSAGAAPRAYDGTRSAA